MVLSLTSMGTAHAVAAGAGEVHGAGTFSPGLTTVATPQAVTMSGVITLADASANGPQTGAEVVIPCSFSGTSTGGETILLGQGVGDWICSGPFTGVDAVYGAGHSETTRCQVTYERRGGYTYETGMCSRTTYYSNGSRHEYRTWRAAYTYSYSSVSPTTSFSFIGVAQWDDVTCPPACV